MKNYWKSYETLRKVSKINLGKSYEDKQKNKTKCKQKQLQNITFNLVIGRGSNSWPLVSCHFSRDGVLLTFNRWRTVVSATWKYDDPRLNMFNRGSSYFHVARTTVCHMFCRLTDYKNLELYVSWSHFRLCICMI